MIVRLIGAGNMAIDYCKVLLALGVTFEVVGRGVASAKSFEDVTGVKVQAGGLDAFLRNHPAPELAIIAVGIELLSDTAIRLVKAGTRRILLEKPGGLSLAELENVDLVAREYGADVWIAYNRRFYASTEKLEELIAFDGGPTSLSFEFTEWSHIIRNQQLAHGVKDHWLLANSSHVVDLAFHICGIPANWSNWHSGTLDWHPAAARFTGAGVTNRGVLFSYLADWESSGRWGIEILTRKRRLVLRPMEQLQQIMLGSVRVEPVEIDDKLDLKFKPGLYRQTQAFLQDESSKICQVAEQVRNIKLYNCMAGYV
jgi:predicted dehydrogenase